MADALEKHDAIPLVLDPVMVSTSGKTLLDGAGIAILKKRLLPPATLVTPNCRKPKRWWASGSNTSSKVR